MSERGPSPPFSTMVVRSLLRTKVSNASDKDVEWNQKNVVDDERAWIRGIGATNIWSGFPEVIDWIDGEASVVEGNSPR